MIIPPAGIVGLLHDLRPERVHLWHESHGGHRIGAGRWCDESDAVIPECAGIPVIMHRDVRATANGWVCLTCGLCTRTPSVA